MKSFFKRHWLILLFVIAKLSIHLVFPNARVWELHRDEYLYLADGQHLAWGYMEIPPLTAFLAYICYLLGNSFFIIKLIPALFGAATIFFIGKMVMEMKGGLFAQALGCLAYLCGVYLRINMLFQPNSLEVLCFAAGAYCLIKYINTHNEKYILFTGIITGIGMLNKYSMLLFVAGVIVGLILTRYRILFTRRKFYFSIGLAFLIFLPNFLWQLIHHFPVAHHMQLLEQNQLQYVSQIGFLSDQLLMNFPVVFVWIFGLLYVFFNREGKKYMLIGWVYITVIIVLLLLHGKNYYSLGAYPMLMAAGGVFLENLTTKKALQYTLRPIFIIVPLWLMMLMAPLLIPIFSPDKMALFCKKYKSLGVLKWEDGKDHALPQDYADMLSWEEITQKVANAYARLDSNEKNYTLLFCDNYGEAAAIDYYRRKYHLPEAYSDDASFLYWIPKDLSFKNILLVTDDQQEMQHPFVKDFAYAAVSDSVTNKYARERGSLIIIFKGANQKFKKMFQQKIAGDNAHAHW